MNKKCRWCREKDQSPTNANGWCKDCENRDRENPPEKSIHQEKKPIRVDLKPEIESDEPIPHWPFPWKV